MARILLTGATGALGSVLMATLTQAGHDVVCLARDKGAEPAAKRVGRLARERGAIPHLIHVMKGDICEPRCGVSIHHRDFYRGRIDLLLHCAASISFESKDRDVTFATNVTGVQQMLALAEDLGINDIRHISTTYVSGDATLFTELDRYKGQRLRNYYEETKQAGESVVHGWAMSDPENRRYIIIRPSILVGSFETGWSPTFDAFYGFFRIVHGAAEAARNYARKAKPLPEDIRVAPDGQVTMPFVIRASQTSTLNLVPVDWCARAVATLVSLPPNNGVCHLAHTNPPFVADVIRHSCGILGIEGFRMVSDDAAYRDAVQGHSKLAAVLQRKFGSELDRYVPYTTHEARFGTAIASTVLGTGLLLPEVSRAVLEKLLTFAVTANWGVTRERVSA